MTTTFQPLAVRTGAREIDQDELHFQQVKVAIHEELVDSLELSLLAQVDPDQMAGRVRTVAEEICREKSRKIKDIDWDRMLRELDFEVFGLGPIEPLMHDETISDILVNNAYEVFIERRGLLHETDVIFADDAHLIRIIQRIVSRVGRRIDEVSPLVDARLPDGSRVNAIIPPLALDGPTLSIRRFGADPLKINDLLKLGSVTQEMVDFLAAAIEARISFLISGGTGSGKTTMLNALTRFIPQEERLVTIEDSAELILQHRHVIRLETRPPNTEGTGEIPQRQLVRNSLRMRPDRIIVGEVRGPEAFDMMQAMNTGHNGSMSTIHSNSARDALARIENMILMANVNLPMRAIRGQIASAIDLVIHTERMRDGVRRVTEVVQIVGLEEEIISLGTLFHYNYKGENVDGTLHGNFEATRVRPRFLPRLDYFGLGSAFLESLGPPEHGED
jgi:pilus assembly protein CpaF